MRKCMVHLPRTSLPALQRADGNVILSCLETALHVAKIIVQGDNAEIRAGKLIVSST